MNQLYSDTRQELEIVLRTKSYHGTDGGNLGEQIVNRTATAGNGWEILSRSPVITHAMGGFGGETYLNCLEGFLKAYENGSRVFEADLCLTSDGYVVLRHDWGWDINVDLQDGIGLSHIPTREEFLSVPILGKYTPLSSRDLINLMDRYRDICVVTDTKYSETEITSTMLHLIEYEAEKMGKKEIVDRFIIQAYSMDMIRSLMSTFDFSDYIYTLYQQPFSGDDEEFQSICAFCESNGVRAVAMPVEWWKDSFAEIAKQSQIFCFVHPVSTERKRLIC